MCEPAGSNNRFKVRFRSGMCVFYFETRGKCQMALAKYLILVSTMFIQ